MVLVVALLLMVARLVDVQIIHSGTYQTDARNESHHPTTLSSLRGGIYARDGAPLALSVPTDDVIADNFQIAHPMKTALGAFPARPHSRRHACSRAPPAFGICRAGQADLAERRPEDRG